MKLQDLKENREQILKDIRTNYPEIDVKEFMQFMVNTLPMADSTNTVDYVNEVGELMVVEKIDLSVFHKVEEMNQKISMNCRPSSMR